MAQKPDPLPLGFRRILRWLHDDYAPLHAGPDGQPHKLRRPTSSHGRKRICPTISVDHRPVCTFGLAATSIAPPGTATPNSTSSHPADPPSRPSPPSPIPSEKPSKHANPTSGSSPILAISPCPPGEHQERTHNQRSHRSRLSLCERQRARLAQRLDTPKQRHRHRGLRYRPANPRPPIPRSPAHTHRLR